MKGPIGHRDLSVCHAFDSKPTDSFCVCNPSQAIIIRSDEFDPCHLAMGVVGMSLRGGLQAR